MWNGSPHHRNPPAPAAGEPSDDDPSSETRGASLAAYGSYPGAAPYAFDRNVPPSSSSASGAHHNNYGAAAAASSAYPSQQQPPIYHHGGYAPPPTHHRPYSYSSSGAGGPPPPSDSRYWGPSLQQHQQPPNSHDPYASKSSSGSAAKTHLQEEDQPMASPSQVPRGKPEAMAARLAAKHVESARQELAAEQMDTEDDDKNLKQTTAHVNHADDDDDDEDDDEVIAQPVVDGGVLANLDTIMEAVVVTVNAAPKPTKKTKSQSKAASSQSKSASSSKKRTKESKAKVSSSASAAATTSSSTLQVMRERTERLLEEHVAPITDVEYANLEALMVQFCKVPLLNEFSRPVAVLHPELMASYSKIVSHPVDMGRVCRGIRGRKYSNTRDIRLDMWRVFANCVKFHSHPNNKDALPSFVSIGLHLREYFNALWDEYMIPSDLPENAPSITHAAFTKRNRDRKKRLDNSGVLVFSKKHLRNTKTLLDAFIQSGARVDRLDKTALWDRNTLQPGDIMEVVQNLQQLSMKLVELTDERLTPEDAYALSLFHSDLMACIPSDILEDDPVFRKRFLSRLDRFFWKRCCPLHEANCRGVTQSSIWGNTAATIWARESSKKPYWPALCLGILSPSDQRESWHATVTERNERRLPEKLRTQLVIARRKCELAQQKQSYSWFLVEFLGTHEFIWVRETDIVDSFDPEVDPNTAASTANKRKKSSRSATTSAVSSKTYATAISECLWAGEEYENILLDAFDEDSGNAVGQDSEDEDQIFTFAALAQADDEVDDELEHGFQYDVDSMTLSDVEEANHLLTHDGEADLGKKKKSQPKKSPVKKKAPEKEKSSSADASRKAKAELAKRKVREKEEKKELRELERRRKKRTRDREKALKDAITRKSKRPRSMADVDDDRGLASNKHARANAIVKAYITRMTKNEEDYKSLALNGVMSIPAAMVESTGLIGMALAFRTAAGELTTPDDSEDQIVKTAKPWATIDSAHAKTSTERSEALSKQVKLLENEINRVKEDSIRRYELTQEAIAKRLQLEEQIEADDIAARVNHFRRKKKSSPNKPDPKGDTPGSKERDDEDDDDDDDDDESMEVEDVEAEAVVAANGEDALDESHDRSDTETSAQPKNETKSLAIVDASPKPQNEESVVAQAIASLAGIGG